MLGLSTTGILGGRGNHKHLESLGEDGSTQMRRFLDGRYDAGDLDWLPIRQFNEFTCHVGFTKHRQGGLLGENCAFRVCRGGIPGTVSEIQFENVEKRWLCKSNTSERSVLAGGYHQFMRARQASDGFGFGQINSKLFRQAGRT